MRNIELTNAINSLEKLGDTSLPLPVALRMVKMRRYFVAVLEDIDEARKQFVENNLAYTDKKGVSHSPDTLDSNHPNFGNVVASIDALLNEEVDLTEHEPLILYEKDGAYSWTEEFTTTEVEDITPNVLFGLMPILELQPV